jgi:hypothetical protein
MSHNDKLEIMAYMAVKWEWSDYSCGFTCPCGSIVVLTESGVDETCECGRRYRMQGYVETTDPELMLRELDESQ